MFHKLMILHLLLISIGVNADESSKEKALYGLKYEKNIKAIDGRSIRWNISLFPNGKFTWFANTTQQNKYACSESAGYFVSKLDADKKKALSELAYKSAQTQDSSKARPSRGSFGSSLSVEYGNELISRRIHDSHSKQHKAFMKELNKYLQSSFTKTNNRASVLAIKAQRRKNNQVEVIISNMGKLDTLITLDKVANYTFKILSEKDESINLEYSDHLKNSEIKIKSNDEVKLTLRADRPLSSDKFKILFVNKEVNGPLKSMDLRLCSDIKGSDR